MVRAQELCADQDVLPARDGIGWVDGYIYKRWHQHTWTTEDDGVLQGWERTYKLYFPTMRLSSVPLSIILYLFSSSIPF